MRHSTEQSPYYEAAPRPGALRRLGSSTVVKCLTAGAIFSSIPAPVKGEGPYLPEIAASVEQHTSIPGTPAKALRLADTFDGILSTSGDSVMVDPQRIEPYLNEHRFAVASETDEKHDAENQTVVQKRVIISQKHPLNADSITNSQLDIFHQYLDQTLRADSTGNAQSDAYAGPPTGLEPIGEGKPTHSDDTSHISLTVYEFKPDGSVAPVETKETTATSINNVKCPTTSLISADVVLTPSQLTTVCNAEKKYHKLTHSSTKVTLDSVQSASGQLDSAAVNPDLLHPTALLTYPYIGDKEVAPRALERVMLHEFLHNTLQAAPQPIVEQFDKAYSNIRQAMRYQLPNDETQQTSSTSVREIEPVWGIITEGTYLSNDRKAGHPWDYHEMSSSIAAVLAYFPEEFCKNLHTMGLSRQEKEAVYGGVLATAALIKSTGVAVKDIIPQYDLILGQLKKSIA